jgi:hypothetical protein
MLKQADVVDCAQVGLNQRDEIIMMRLLEPHHDVAWRCRG